MDSNKKKRKFQEKIQKGLGEVFMKSFEEVVHNCSTVKMFCKFQEILGKTSL